MKKIIILGIICLFVGMGFQPAFANNIMENNPPYVPSDPIPPDGATNWTGGGLCWTGGDPDGDSVTYDVYFGNSSSPPQIGWNQTSNWTFIKDIEFNTTYYWKIVAWDEHGASTPGLIWTFTTGENSPPGAPNVWWSPKRPEPFSKLILTFNSVDPDGDDVRFIIEWPDGETDHTIYVPSGTNTTKSHMTGPKGTYYINVTAGDYNGDMSQTTTVKIIVGRSKAVNIEDCDCQTSDNNNFPNIENLLIKAKHFINSLLTKFGHLPEVKEKCHDLLKVFDRDGPLCLIVWLTGLYFSGLVLLFALITAAYEGKPEESIYKGITDICYSFFCVFMVIYEDVLKCGDFWSEYELGKLNEIKQIVKVV